MDTDRTERALGVLRSQALDLDTIGQRVRTALFASDLSSPTVSRLTDRSDRFGRVADELGIRVDIIRQFEIDPGSVPLELAEAAGVQGLESIDTIAELNWKIDNWSGTDNDPIFDALVRERSRLIEDRFDTDGSAIDPLVAAVAEANNLSYEEADLAVIAFRIDELTTEMQAVNNPWSTDQWRRLDAERDVLLARLLADDQAVADNVASALNDGIDLFDAIGPAVQAVYGESSIAELQEAMGRHGADGSFGVALFDLADLHSEAVEAFTGVPSEEVNPMIAALAQSDGLAYNALVDQFNDAIDRGDVEGETVSYIEINGTIPNDATLVWNLSQRQLFEEIETSRQGDRSQFDGKMSAADLRTIVDNPADFSDGVVAAAQMLLADDELRGRIDTAGSRQFLDGLANGTHSFEGTDGIISFADVEQHITNSLIYDLLSPEADAIDLDGDGSITESEFQARLAAVDPDGSVAAAIEYALSDEAFSDRDQRSTWQKIGDGVSTINSLNPMNPAFHHRLLTDPGGLAGDYGSFATGLLWEFPKGLAVLAYDFSSLVPGSPAYLIETHTNIGGEEHRGVAMLTGLAEVADVGLTLVPGTPQFFEELERVRLSGRRSDHAGIGLVTTVADWETFVDDPARWFGTITGDVMLTAATGGYGGLATRSATGLRAGTLVVDKLQDVRHLRNWAGTRLDLARSNARTQAAYLRSWATSPSGLRLPTAADLDRLADAIFGTPQLAGVPGSYRGLDLSQDVTDFQSPTILQMSSTNIPGPPPGWKLDSISQGHGWDKHGDLEMGLTDVDEYRSLIDDTIENATNGGVREDGTNWWYNEETQFVVYENPTPNSFGDYGTAYEITFPNQKLPDGTVINPE